MPPSSTLRMVAVGIFETGKNLKYYTDYEKDQNLNN
jgi:hypothetical protein